MSLTQTRETSPFIVVFTIVLCGALAVGLTWVADFTKENALANRELEEWGSVLRVMGFTTDAAGKPIELDHAKAKALFESRIVKQIVKYDYTGDLKAANPKWSDAQIAKEAATLRPIQFRTYWGWAKQKPEGDQSTWSDETWLTADAFVFETQGLGMWKQIDTLICVDTADFETIKNVNYWKQEETPGLGARVQEEWFVTQHLGKKLRNRSAPVSSPGYFLHLTPSTGELGQVSSKGSTEIDKITGATVTSDGVTLYMRQDLADFYRAMNQRFPTRVEGLPSTAEVRN
jgi:Na+-transporting NADH:ubiquinone oxidoreductase subunit C